MTAGPLKRAPSLTVRHPVDIAVSWQQFCASAERKARTVEANMLRWQHMVLQVLRSTDDVKHRIFVEYEDLARTPLAYAERLASFLDDSLGVSTPSLTVERMGATCDPQLWRNRDGRRNGDDRVSVAQQALYDLQRTRVTEPSAPPGNYPMPLGWHAQVMAEEAREG